MYIYRKTIRTFYKVSKFVNIQRHRVNDGPFIKRPSFTEISHGKKIDYFDLLDPKITYFLRIFLHISDFS